MSAVRRLRTALRPIVPVLAVAALVAGCGSGNSTSSQTAGRALGPSAGASASDSGAVEPDAAAARAVLDRWMKAYVAGDGATACALMSADYTRETLAFGAKQGFWKPGTSCPDAVVASAALIRAFGGSSYTLHQDGVDGPTVTFTVVYDDTRSDDEYYDLTLTDGQWLVTADPENKGSNAAKASRSAGQAQTARWVSNWCRLKPGQTRDQAKALMGPPTTVFTVADGATPQFSWEQGPYSFTAFFDTDWKIDRFYANYDDLGNSDLAQMPCYSSRPQT